MKTKGDPSNSSTILSVFVYSSQLRLQKLDTSRIISDVEVNMILRSSFSIEFEHIQSYGICDFRSLDIVSFIIIDSNRRRPYKILSIRDKDIFLFSMF